MRELNTLTEEQMEDLGIDQRLGNFINDLLLEVSDLQNRVTSLENGV